MDKEQLPQNKKKTPKIISRLKQERERRNLTQDRLAELIGSTQNNISRWEQGKTQPSAYFRVKLEQLFGKSSAELGLVEGAQPEYIEEINESAPPQKLPDIWNVPYRRNLFFTGRESLLRKLHSMLAYGTATNLIRSVSISGLGGIGKTQIAVEYAYRFLDHYKAIVWVNASSSDLHSDYVLLAALFKLPEQKEQDQHIIINAVRRWFEVNTHWLLIFDGVDDPKLVKGFLPRLGKGSILITTRQHTLGDIAEPVAIVKMEKKEGTEFLLRRVRMLPENRLLEDLPEGEQLLAGEIVDTLDGLPLAIDQAGAYIEETRCRLQDYLELYRSRHKELLKRRGGRSSDHPESVTATWSLSFEQIQKDEPATADLLRLLAFFNPEAIAEEMIAEGVGELRSASGSLLIDPLEFNEAIGTLMDYSLIHRNADKAELSMHLLVQVVLKDSLSEDEQRYWAERAIRVLNQTFPNAEPSTWSKCQRYIPHVQACLTSVKQYAIAIPEAAALFTRAGRYLREHAQYMLAEELLQSSLDIWKQLQLFDNAEAAVTQSELGLLYLDQGKYQQAEEPLQKGLNIRQHTRGLQDAGTAASLDHLGQLYYALGRYAESEKLYQQALDIRQQVFSTKNREVATSLTHLAELYSTTGSYRQAVNLYKQAQDIQQEILEPEHPDVAGTLNDLALVYRRMGRYSEAEQLYWRSYNIFLDAYGNEHPYIAEVLNNLARLYRAQAEFEKAEPYYLQALKIREKVFGPEHPSVAQSLHKLAKLYHSQGKYSQAIEHCERALYIQEQKLGEEHPDTASVLIELGKLYQAQDKYQDAENEFKRARTIFEKVLGNEHPHVALALSHLGELYAEQRNYNEARPLIEKSLDIRRKTLGPEHPYLAYGLTSLAAMYAYEERFPEAERLYFEALAIRRHYLGAIHPYVALIYRKLAELYLDTKRYILALQSCEAALLIQKETYETTHPEIVKTNKLFSSIEEEKDRAFRESNHSK